MRSEFQRQSHRTKTNNAAASEREEKDIFYGLTLTTERRRLRATLWNTVNTYRLRRHLETPGGFRELRCCFGSLNVEAKHVRCVIRATPQKTLFQSGSIFKRMMS